MDIKKLREKTQDELKKRLVEKKAQFNESVYDKAKGQIKNYSEIKYIRKEIARIKTILQNK